jgi:hypothetical protein
MDSGTVERTACAVDTTADASFEDITCTFAARGDAGRRIPRSRT